MSHVESLLESAAAAGGDNNTEDPATTPAEDGDLAEISRRKISQEEDLSLPSGGIGQVAATQPIRFRCGGQVEGWEAERAIVERTSGDGAIHQGVYVEHA